MKTASLRPQHVGNQGWGRGRIAESVDYDPTEWVELHGGEFLVHRSGKIRRVIHIETIGGKDGAGYLVIKVRDKTWKVHRLIAEAFLGPCPEGFVVNHRDGNKQNNALNNLEYVTPSENSLHAVRLGLVKPPNWRERKENVGIPKRLTVEKVRAIRGKYDDGEGICALSRVYGVSRHTIRQVVRRRSWKDVV